MDPGNIRRCRYGTWYNNNVMTANPLEWAKTPRSRVFKCMRRSVTVPGILASDSGDRVELRIAPEIGEAILRWCAPPDGLYAPDTGATVRLHGRHVVFDEGFMAQHFPLPSGTACWVRVNATSRKMCGTVHKILLHAHAVMPVPS